MEAEDYDPNGGKDGEEPVIIEGTAQAATAKAATAKAGNKRSKPPSGLAPKAKKIYPKRAWVWKHFIQRNDDDPFSYCKYCQQKVGCDSKKSGTSAMTGHIDRCQKYKDFKEMETQTVLGSDKRGDMRVIRYDPELYRQCTNQLVVMNELPLSFVESEGWKRYCLNMLPMYHTFSRRTASKDIAGMFLQEKEELKHLFGVEQQRVSLTTDIWVSQTTSVNYMVVTAHWIDENWAMQKRILSFEGLDSLYNRLVRSKGPVEGCSELDIYLTEKAEVRVESSLGFPYDVLSWWKCNSQKFPILSAMAKDVLAIQVSSVASESVFSTSGRVLDPYRSSLTPFMVEVLLLTQQWLRCNFKADDEVANITQMMEDAAFFESLDSRNAQTQ